MRVAGRLAGLWDHQVSQKPLRMLYVTATLEPGGLQKRCVQIASEAARRGHRVGVGRLLLRGVARVERHPHDGRGVETEQVALVGDDPGVEQRTRALPAERLDVQRPARREPEFESALLPRPARLSSARRAPACQSPPEPRCSAPCPTPN